MVTVDYHHEIPYAYDVNGRHYPRLTLRLANLGDPEQAIDLDAYLDSGAQRSLFDGRLAPVVGIDLLAGQVFKLQSTTGPECVNNFETPVAGGLVSNAALPRVRVAWVLES